MSYYSDILMGELERNLRAQKIFKRKIEMMPRGSVFVQERNGRCCRRAARRGKKEAS